MRKKIFTKRKVLKPLLPILFTGSILLTGPITNGLAAAVVDGSTSYPDLNTALNAANQGSVVSLTSDETATSFQATGIDILTINSTSNTIWKIQNGFSSNKGGALNFGPDSTANTLNLTNIEFFNNTSSDDGGAVHSSNNLTTTMQNVSFIDNKSDASGGGLYVIGTLNADMQNVSFINNTVDINGGAIRTSGSATITGNNILFQNNQSLNGGAIRPSNFINIASSNTTFDNNAANRGGAIYVDSSGTGYISNLSGENMVFSNNKSDERGGAIFHTVENGQLNLLSDNMIFTNNTAGGGPGGGAIHKAETGNQLNIDGSNIQFLGNRANSSNGGAISGQNGIINVNGNQTIFQNNTAGINGGAIYATGNETININGNDTVFENNSAGGSGGAIHIEKELNISGNNTYFNNNTAAGNTNSIHINAVIAGGSQLNISSNGNTYIYDPLSSSGTENVSINKTGNGLFILGGKNQMNAAQNNWNIQNGTMLITRDSQDSMFSINNNGINSSFTLDANANLLVALNPNDLTDFAKITSDNITLNGAAGIGNDYRAANEINFIPGEKVTVLQISNGTNNMQVVPITQGQFSSGLYNYDYTNLHWENDKNLVLYLKSSSVDPDRSGGNAAQYELLSTLNEEHFRRIPIAFEKLNQQNAAKSQELTTDELKKQDENFWGESFFNYSKLSSTSEYSSSTIKTPGLILGYDKAVNANTFLGAAISATWPKFNQGQTDIDGQNIRLYLYGGSQIGNGFELGYKASYGFSRNKHSRYAGSNSYDATYDSNSYIFGLSLSKTYENAPNRTTRPFIEYDYITVNTDGYSENGFGGADISTNKHNENVSRVRIGAEFKKILNNDKNYLSAAVFYNGLFGDTTATTKSWLNSDPTNIVNAHSSSVNKHALGLNLSYNKELSKKSEINLAYRGLYGSRGYSHDINVMYNYKF